MSWESCQEMPYLMADYQCKCPFRDRLMPGQTPGNGYYGKLAFGVHVFARRCLQSLAFPVTHYAKALLSVLELRPIEVLEKIDDLFKALLLYPSSRIAGYHEQQGDDSQESAGDF
jgi:hypothetical protein